MRNSDFNSRILWHSIVIDHLEQNNIAWSIWDYKGEFGLFEKGSAALFDYDLNVKLLEAMNLFVPDQKEFLIQPDSAEINIYSDFVGRLINIDPWASSNIDYYSSESINETGYGIYWSGAPQYSSIRFDFAPDKDFSFLAENDFQTDFWIKAKGNVESLDIRFLDTKTGEAEHPWRMKYTLSPFDYQSDNNWYHIQIPLKYFSEGGSWDNNQWFDAIGLFDWSAVDYFEITSEYENFNGAEFWFDEIKIINPNAVAVKDKINLNNEFQLFQNYPNPFNPLTTITFYVPAVGQQHAVDLRIYDILGNEIAALTNKKLSQGKHEIKFDSLNLSSGIYFYQLRAGKFIDTKKMILLK
ncbi:MAG: T9SS type A sorting domain-containing protein [Melioribacteraceae bacterium]|nr:MAG: T9SS type A sorting domain-containing protein [Melioribacteraceae bacterium]